MISQSHNFYVELITYHYMRDNRYLIISPFIEKFLEFRKFLNKNPFIKHSDFIKA